MVIRLSDEARRYIAAFEEVTGVAVIDCLPEDDRVTFVVPPDDMPAAIGPDGRTVSHLEERFGRDVSVIEDAERPAVFVANALAPAAVYGVEITEDDDGRVATAEVDEADMGVAIGADGHRIDRASRLASRHFDIDRVELDAH